jgi:hypothetical protein
MTDARQSRCPVTGCGVWKNALSKRGGSNRWWYSVDSNRHLLIGLLDETLAALPCNDHICPNCYKRIRRLPPLAHNLLDELTAAANEQPPTPPPPPSPPSPSPPPPPLTSYQPPPPPSSTYQRVASESSASRQPVASESYALQQTPPPCSPIHIRRSASATKRALVQLVNQQLPHPVKRIKSGRVREFTHTEKQYLLDDWRRGDESTRWGLEWMYNLDKQKRTRWRRTLNCILSSPLSQRPAMSMRRTGGQRWQATNTRLAEQQIFNAVMMMRHKRLPVSIKQLRALAIKFKV